MTTILLFVVMRWMWNWQLRLAVALVILFGTIDTGFFLANVAKILEGGWVSITAAGIMGLIMGPGSAAAAICSTRPAGTRYRLICLPGTF